MRAQVNTLIESCLHLVDIALLFAFFMIVFGVLGLQLFKGTLRHRCYDDAAATAPLDPLGSSPIGVCGSHLSGATSSTFPTSSITHATSRSSAPRLCEIHAGHSSPTV